MQYKAFISYSHSIDGDFTKALQLALQSFGKPWYKIRSFRIFRDGTDLASNPNLWKNIQQSLINSEYFILLASPEAGKSKWVNKEVEEWLKQNKSDKMIIALTSGEMDTAKTVLPVVLRENLESEPFYIDFRSIRKVQDLELGNPEFKTRIAQILSVLTNRPVGDIIGEEVIQHKKTIRLRNFVILILSTLLLIATALALVIRSQREEAEKEALTNQLVSLSLLQEKTDATLALSTVDSAIKILPGNSMALMARNDIYSRNSFYEKIYSHHISSVYQVKAVSDSLFLSASADNSVILHHFDGRALLQLLDDSGTSLSTTDISPDGQLIATGDTRGFMKLWTRDGKMVFSKKVNSGEIRQLVFTPDGEKILTGGLGLEAKLWNLDGKELLKLKGHYASIEDVAISPSGKYFLTSSADATAILWDSTGQKINTLSGHESQVTTIAFSPDEQMILTGGMDKMIRLWDINGDLKTTIIGHSDGITDVEFLSEEILISASYDNTVRSWDMKGNELFRYQGHDKTVTSVSAKVDGTGFLSGSWDKTIKLWDFNSKLYNKLSSHYSVGTSFHPVRNQILIGGGNEAILWDFDADSRILLTGHSSRVRTSNFSKSGEYILTGSESGVIKVWSNLGKELLTIPAQKGSVNDLVFHPNEKMFLSTWEDGKLKGWDMKGDSLFSFQAHNDEIYSIDISPDGSKILTGSVDNTTKLWDIEGRLLNTFEDTVHYNNIIYSVDFSPDGKRIVMGGLSNVANIWNLNGQKIQDFKGHVRAINSVEYSPDGQYIITGSDDNTARIWDLNGNLLLTLFGSAGSIFEAKFSPNGKYILTTNEKGTFVLYNYLTNLNLKNN